MAKTTVKDTDIIGNKKRLEDYRVLLKTYRQRHCEGDSPKQSRKPDNIRFNNFVIRSGAPLAASECVAESRNKRLNLDCFVYFDTSTDSTSSLTTGSVHRFAKRPPRNEGVASFVIIINPKKKK